MSMFTNGLPFVSREIFSKLVFWFFFPKKNCDRRELNPVRQMFARLTRPFLGAPFSKKARGNLES